MTDTEQQAPEERGTPQLVRVDKGIPCACRFEWRPDFDVAGKAPLQLDECGYHAEQRRKLEAQLAADQAENERLKGWGDEIADLFHIGSAARDPETIMQNVRNAARRAQCLSEVEVAMSKTVPGDPDDEEDGPHEECPMNWGAEPAEYGEQFRAEIAALKQRLEALWSVIDQLQVFGTPEHPMGISYATGNDRPRFPSAREAIDAAIAALAAEPPVSQSGEMGNG